MPAQKYPLILEIHGGPFAPTGPLLDRLPALRGGRLRRALRQPARLDRLRPGVRRRDRQDLSRARLRRPDERGRCRDRERPCRSRQSVRHRRLGRRHPTAWIVGKTDRFKAAAAQKPVINWTSMALTVRRRRPSSPLLARQDAVGKPAILLVTFTAQPGRQRQDPDPGRGRQRRLSHARQRSRAILHRAQAQGVPTDVREGARRQPRRIAARPSQSAAKASAIIAWFDRYRTKADRAGRLDRRGFPARPRAN